MKLKILVDFPYFHGGCNRVDYEKGSEVDVEDQEMVEVAIKEGWAKEVKGRGAAASGSDSDAKDPPENKAQANAPENK